MSIPVDPTSTTPAPNSAKLADMPISQAPGSIPGSPPAGEESYIDTQAVDDFAESTFARIHEKSEMGKKSVGRTNGSALGDFPEALAALSVHEKIRQAYLQRFGQLSNSISGNHKATGKAVASYIELDAEGRKYFTTSGNGQGV